jgi:carbon monoxide dehydrogenase subunit G
MSTIVTERDLSSPADEAWRLLEDAGNVQNAFPGIVAECELDDAGVRTVTFENGTVVREIIVTVDCKRRRVAYSIQDRFAVHGASMQILDQPDGGARFRWYSDFLPESSAPAVQAMMERGADAFVRAVADSAS